MNNRELRRRAKILALANTVHSLESADTGGDEEAALIDAAVDWAHGELEKLGMSAANVTSVRSCLSIPLKGSNDSFSGPQGAQRPKGRAASDGCAGDDKA